jgi:hypothetical protein
MAGLSLLLAETVMAAFFEPARNSVIPNIAAPEEVLVANTLSSATWSVNLLIGASIGGSSRGFLRTRCRVYSECIVIPLVGHFHRGMRFAEPHAESAAPLRPRDLVRLLPVLEGIRYVRNHRTLLPAVFAKAGELMIGPSWVIFTVLGAHEFAVHWRNVDPAGGAMLGMSILLGGRGLGALVGPVISARWAGRSDRRLQLGILHGLSDDSRRIRNPRHLPHGLDSQRLRAACACGRIHSLGLLHNPDSTSHRGPFSRASLLGRPGLFHAHHRRRCLFVWPFHGCRYRRPHRRQLDGISHVGSSNLVDAGNTQKKDRVDAVDLIPVADRSSRP